MKKTGIIMVSNHNEIGGATKSMLSLANKLNETSKICVITPHKKNVYEYCKKNNIFVVVIPYIPYLIADSSSKINSFVRHILKPILIFFHNIVNFISVKYAHKYIDFDNYQIIHTNMIRDDFGMQLAKKYNKKHIMHLREFGNIDYKYIYLKKEYIKYIDKGTNLFIAISDSIKEHYINKGISEYKLKRIYNGVDVDNIVIKNSAFLNEGLIKIIFTGGITENKGQADLINAMKNLPKEIQKKIIVDFYGKEDEKYVNYLKKIISEEKIMSKINFKGYVSNINELLCNYDIGMMCSVSEAFGRTTIEYMAAGLVVIASNKGANNELIKDNINGIIYNKDNLESLSNILKHIANSEIDLSNISQNAIKYSRKNFSSDLNAKNIFNEYLKINGGENE